MSGQLIRVSVLATTLASLISVAGCAGTMAQESNREPVFSYRNGHAHAVETSNGVYEVDVTVKAMTRTGGWTRPALERAKWPGKGLQLRMTAIPPETPTTQTLSTVEASRTFRVEGTAPPETVSLRGTHGGIAIPVEIEKSDS